MTRDFASEATYTKRSKEFHTHDEIWCNDIYMVFLTRKHPALNPAIPPMTWLSIKRHDKEPCNDWRDFQFIKNQLVGEECEASQLYPAESRLVDGSNQYHLFCLVDPTLRFPYGFNDGRVITETPFDNGKQRPWPDNMKPKDLKAQDERIRDAEKLYRESFTKSNDNGQSTSQN